MPKTLSDIQAILKNPVKRAEIEKARAVEDRVRLHSEASLSANDCSRAVTEFLMYVKGLLKNYNNHRLFTSMFRFPVDTVALTSNIYDSLEKVFDGRDPIYNIDFLTEKAHHDWEDYRSKKLNLDWFWRNESFCELREAFRSFVVVDLPPVQETTLPEPYPYFLRQCDVIDYELEPERGGSEGYVDWMVFAVNDNTIAFFDKYSYRLFETKSNKEIIKEISDVPHNLGYCPVAKFWCEDHPLTTYLSKLDKLLFNLVSKDVMDLGNSYPVWWVYETDCDYVNPDTQDYCDGGFMRSTVGVYLMDRGGISSSPRECPKCKGKFRGAGTVLELPVPKSDDKSPLGVPAGIIATNVRSLDYHVREVERRSAEIYNGVVGTGGEPINDQAKNEKQVMSGFESRTDVLKKLKKHFERIQTWTDTTLCKLRYSDIFVSLHIDYGKTFYLETPEQLMEYYQRAQLKGAPDEVLDDMLLSYYTTKYRNNKAQLYREKVLMNLDPFRHRTLDQVAELYYSGDIGFPEYYLKFNFSSLIAQFERENTSVTNFGEALNFNSKIESIKQTLLGYGKEAIEANKENTKQAIDGGRNTRRRGRGVDDRYTNRNVADTGAVYADT